MSIVTDIHHHCSGKIFLVSLDGLLSFFFFFKSMGVGEETVGEKKERRKLKVKKM